MRYEVRSIEPGPESIEAEAVATEARRCLTNRTYSQVNTHGGSFAMRELIQLRGEEPTFVGTNDADHDGVTLWEFADGTEVLETNAGIETDYSTGFAATRDAIRSGM